MIRIRNLFFYSKNYAAAKKLIERERAEKKNMSHELNEVGKVLFVYLVEK